MVGLASAAVVARVTGAPRSPELWLGAFVASGLPDLDLVLGWLGLRGPRFHRNASHSLIVIGVVLLVGWGAVKLLALGVDWGIMLAWSAALVSHPVLDVLTTGPTLGARDYGIGLLWPLHSKRWFVGRPFIDQTTDWGACRTVADVWAGVRPEIVRLVPIAALVIALTLVL
ncbi:MAG: hypothetical protein GTO22_00025 [Gemmatimonadales bacterium]|nr:hypothetical protein [Gemmatimonadales bacterium]